MGWKLIYLPHAQIAIYDSKIKLFLKQGISHQLGCDAVVRFECENSAIDVIIIFLWIIFSTSQSYLWFWPPLILGGSVISAGTIHDLRWVKVPGTCPLWNPWILVVILIWRDQKKFLKILSSPSFCSFEIYTHTQYWKGLSWPWSYGSWIYNYLYNQCLSSLMLWVWISIRARCTTLCDKVCQWLATGRWFYPGHPIFLNQ